MPEIGPTGAQGNVPPPQPSKIEGKKDFQTSPPQNSLQAEIQEAEALLKNGNKDGAVQLIDQVLQQLGPGATIPNAAKAELLAAKSLIEGGAAPSYIIPHLTIAFDLLGSPKNTPQSFVLNIMAEIENGGKGLAATEQLIQLLQQSKGPPSVVQAALNKLMAALSEMQGGSPPSMIIANLDDAFHILGNL